MKAFLCAAVFSGLCCASVSVLGLSHALAASTAAESGSTTLSFSVTDDVRVPATRLTVRLYARADNVSPIEAQKSLNARIAAAMKLASGHDGVEVRASSYNTYEETPEHGRARWIARQDVMLSGKEADRILDLAGSLQAQGLVLEGTDWSLDPATRTQSLKKAREDALAKVRGQAEESAKVLGLRLVRLKDVRINTDFVGVRPQMALMSMARSAPAEPPQSGPEEQTVSVTVSVEAELGE